MAEDRLRVDHEQVIEKATQLEQAIATYRELGENPLQMSLGQLGEMNSNFVARLERMLGSLDGKNPDLLETMESISGSAAEIAESFIQLDEDMVAAMGAEE